jgi:hypothetical protein
MNRIWIAWKAACLLTLLFPQLMTAQSYQGEIDSSKLPSPRDHYMEEYTLDESTAPARWLEQTPGMHVSFASNARHYLRAEVPELTESFEWTATGRNGNLNTMRPDLVSDTPR